MFLMTVKIVYEAVLLIEFLNVNDFFIQKNERCMGETF
jgi:hypothetical protein